VTALNKICLLVLRAYLAAAAGVVLVRIVELATGAG